MIKYTRILITLKIIKLENKDIIELISISNSYKKAISYYIYKSY